MKISAFAIQSRPAPGQVVLGFLVNHQASLVVTVEELNANSQVGAVSTIPAVFVGSSHVGEAGPFTLTAGAPCFAYVHEPGSGRQLASFSFTA